MDKSEKFITQYRNWLVETDYFYKRFNLLADALEEFIINIISDTDSAKQVASQFESVLSNCDEIDYESYDATIAYSILHFLPRYHLFQLTFSKLFDKHILPNKKEPINSLDIGTGPSPVLYALSDIYESLIEFGSIKKNLEYKPDYVEQSCAFRHFIHNFTEYLNYKYRSQKEKWVVPYHHGTFNSFENINFNLKTNDYKEYKKSLKLRYDIISSANFFTRLDQVKKQKYNIQHCIRNLKRNGIFVVWGANAKNNYNKNKCYQTIYKQLKHIIEKCDYSTVRYKAKAKKCKLTRNLISFNYSDKFGGRIKQFHKRIISMLIHLESLDAIGSERTKKVILNCIKDNYNYTYKTEVHVFVKRTYPHSNGKFYQRSSQRQ